MNKGAMVQDAIGILVAVVVIGAVAVPVAIDAMVTDTQSVTNETISSGGSVPEVITVSTVKDGLKEDSETLYLNDSTGGIAKLTESTNYTVVDYDTGEFNITSAPNVSSTDDSYLATYEYKPDGYIESKMTRTIVDFVPLALGLAIFVGALSLVRG